MKSTSTNFMVTVSEAKPSLGLRLSLMVGHRLWSLGGLFRGGTSYIRCSARICPWTNPLPGLY